MFLRVFHCFIDFPIFHFFFVIKKFGWDWSLEESKLILCKLDITCGLGKESINLIPWLISIPFPAPIFWLVLSFLSPAYLHLAFNAMTWPQNIVFLLSALEKDRVFWSLILFSPQWLTAVIFFEGCRWKQMKSFGWSRLPVTWQCFVRRLYTDYGLIACSLANEVKVGSCSSAHAFGKEASFVRVWLQLPQEPPWPAPAGASPAPGHCRHGGSRARTPPHPPASRLRGALRRRPDLAGGCGLSVNLAATSALHKRRYRLPGLCPAAAGGAVALGSPPSSPFLRGRGALRFWGGCCLGWCGLAHCGSAAGSAV